jgi:hypothetical protein
MSPVETYLRVLRRLYTSEARTVALVYHKPLAELFNQVGQSLKPRVVSFLGLKTIGSSLPSGGFFTADQFPKSAGAPDMAPWPPTPPSRGAIEIVESGGDLYELAYSQLLEKHLESYGLVLVTNYWGFVLMGLDDAGRPTELESFALAENEADFWSQTAQARYMAQIHGERFVEFLKRAMLQAAPLAALDEVAWFLASYAREAHGRIAYVTALTTEPVHATSLLQSLDDIRLTFELTLGLTFEGEKGLQLFRLSLIQTLFYAIFAAWVLWHYEDQARQDRFDWKLAHWYLRLSFIYGLFRQLTQSSHIGIQVLDLAEVFNWSGNLLNRVDRPKFFDQFQSGPQIEQFCELFLQAFSPQLLKALGVWYTPPEVAHYMVARVDAVLRETLGVPDGLANETVQLLDPCCGSGTYLIETLKRIATSLQQKGDAAAASYGVKKAALKHVFGFEMMPAACIMAHLRLALYLHQVDMPFTATERARVYLTNALLGWQRPADASQASAVPLPEFQIERENADIIKQSQKILVVIGNPPTHNLPGLTISTEPELALVYLRAGNTPALTGPSEPYLAFFRLAERQIVAQNGTGVICYISNYTWLDQPTLKEMRQRYLEAFGHIWIDSLNGDKFKTGNLTPEGEPDPNIFSTRFNREGAQVGTAITLLVRQEPHRPVDRPKFRNLWGTNKLAQLAESIGPELNVLYQTLASTTPPGFSFLPAQQLSDYLTWPAIADLFPVSLPGLKTNHDPRPTPTEQAKPRPHVRNPANPSVESKDGVKYSYRPFDSRYLYEKPTHESGQGKEEDVITVSRTENRILVCRRKAEHNQEGVPFYITTLAADRQLIRPASVCFPITLKRPHTPQQSLFDQLPERAPANLSANAHKYLLAIGIKDPDADEETAGLLGHHIIAVGYAPEFLTENRGALRPDWPRIPVPNNQIAIRKSAALGHTISALLDVESPLSGVTSGLIRSELSLVGKITRIDDKELNPDVDLALTANWRSGEADDSVALEQGYMVKRKFTASEQAALEKGAAALGLTLDQLDRYLGSTTCDIYLNDQVYWANIPLKVWEYTVGGYQVLKIWLSQRIEPILGRPLMLAEARAARDIARRLMTLTLMGPALDENYRAVKRNSYSWPNVKQG